MVNFTLYLKLIVEVSRFHWIRCQVDAISECSTANDIRIALRSLPKDLNETYERILWKVVDKGEATAARAQTILMWLVGSMRPLGLLELQEALMVEPGSMELNETLRLIRATDILAICGSLVEEFLDKDGLRMVQLSHYTVQASTNHRYL